MKGFASDADVMALGQEALVGDSVKGLAKVQDGHIDGHPFRAVQDFSKVIDGEDELGFT